MFYFLRRYQLQERSKDIIIINCMRSQHRWQLGLSDLVGSLMDRPYKYMINNPNLRSVSFHMLGYPMSWFQLSFIITFNLCALVFSLTTHQFWWWDAGSPSHPRLSLFLYLYPHIPPQLGIWSCLTVAIMYRVGSIDFSVPVPMWSDLLLSTCSYGYTLYRQGSWVRLETLFLALVSMYSLRDVFGCWWVYLRMASGSQ